MHVHLIDETHLLPCMMTGRKIVTEKTHYPGSDPLARSVADRAGPGFSPVICFLRGYLSMDMEHVDSVAHHYPHRVHRALHGCDSEAEHFCSTPRTLERLSKNSVIR